MTSYKISGLPRRKLKFTVRALKYQQKKWGFSELREARIRDIERELKQHATTTQHT